MARGDISARTRAAVVRARIVEGAVTAVPFVIVLAIAIILIANKSIKIYIYLPSIAILLCLAFECCGRLDRSIEFLRFRLLDDARIELADWLARSCGDARMIHGWCDYDIGAAAIGDTMVIMADWESEYRMTRIDFARIDSVQLLRGSPFCRIVIKYADALGVEHVKYLSFERNVTAMEWNAALRQGMGAAPTRRPLSV